MSKFLRGYGELGKKTEKAGKYLMSCYNCDSFYESHEDTEEVCQNTEVLPYDMVVSGSTIYCNRWKPISSPPKSKSVKGLFKGKSKCK